MLAFSERLGTRAYAAQKLAGSLRERFWYSRPVRWQILIAFIAITAAVTVTAAVFGVLDARRRAEIEMRAPMELSERFVRETAASLKGGTGALVETLATALRHLRHVRIVVTDSSGMVLADIAGAREEGSSGDELEVPSWFMGLVAPERDTREIAIAPDGKKIATVTLYGDPIFEIAEVWTDFRTLALMWLLENALMMGVLYVVLGRILKPLVNIARGMRELEGGRFDQRLEPPKVRELGVIADRFNHLASALGTISQENSRLYRDLVSVQEDERHQIANELHDEVGPCLFGITANASSIGRQLEGVPADQQQRITSRVTEILSITERLKSMNRSLLKRLRPVALGRITLSELIGELIAEFGRRHTGVAFSFVSEGLAASYGEAIDLTIYRAVQEGATNALRHSQATRIDVDLRQRDGEEGGVLDLALADDGVGISPSSPPGFGLRTMRERARTQGGTFSIGPGAGGGTHIAISIPITEPVGRLEQA